MKEKNKEKIFDLLKEIEDYSNNEPILNSFNQWVIPEIDQIDDELNLIRLEIGDEKYNKAINEFLETNYG